MKKNEKIGGKKYLAYSQMTRDQVKEVARLLLNAIELHDNEKRKISLHNFKNGNVTASQQAVGGCRALNEIIGNRIKYQLSRDYMRDGRESGHWEIDLVFTYTSDTAPVLSAFLSGIEKIKRKLYFSDQKGITDDDGHKYPITGVRARIVRDLWQLAPSESRSADNYLGSDYYKDNSALSHNMDSINKVFRKEFPPPCDLVSNGPEGYYLNHDSFNFFPLKASVS